MRADLFTEEPIDMAALKASTQYEPVDFRSLVGGLNMASEHIKKDGFQGYLVVHALGIVYELQRRLEAEAAKWNRKVGS